MSKVAILSDIHANLHALEAVLQEVSECGAEILAVAGDLVGYGAYPRECVDLVRRIGGYPVFGNHDELVVEIHATKGKRLEPGWPSNPVYAGAVHAVSELSDEQLDWLRDLPWFRRIGEDVVLAHSSLHAPEKWHYLLEAGDARKTWAIMKEKGFSVAFFGHTHHQNLFADPEADAPFRLSRDAWHLSKDSCCAVTVGSVGQPRGPGRDPRATWALWDAEARTVTFRKTAYPCEEAARAILDAGLPPDSARRLLEGA